MRRFLPGQGDDELTPSSHDGPLRIRKPHISMAGLGKFLKQAQKMQQKVEATQAEIEAHELDVTSGGGAVSIRINGAGKFLSLEINPELLQEESSLVNETILAAVQDAADKAKAYSDEKMKSATAGFQMPGMM